MTVLRASTFQKVSKTTVDLFETRTCPELLQKKNDRGHEGLFMTVFSLLSHATADLPSGINVNRASAKGTESTPFSGGREEKELCYLGFCGILRGMWLMIELLGDIARWKCTNAGV